MSWVDDGTNYTKWKDISCSHEMHQDCSFTNINYANIDLIMQTRFAAFAYAAKWNEFKCQTNMVLLLKNDLKSFSNQLISQNNLF